MSHRVKTVFILKLKTESPTLKATEIRISSHLMTDLESCKHKITNIQKLSQSFDLLFAVY